VRSVRKRGPRITG